VLGLLALHRSSADSHLRVFVAYALSCPCRRRRRNGHSGKLPTSSAARSEGGHRLHVYVRARGVGNERVVCPGTSAHVIADKCAPALILC
jgi:hypothetical protein